MARRYRPCRSEKVGCGPGRLGRPRCLLLRRDAGRGSADRRWRAPARGVSRVASGGKDRCHVQVTEVIVGVVEIAAAFAAGEPAGPRALFILAGLISVAFGVVLCARPHVGAITLALLFGLFNLIIGIWMIVQGIELRRTGKTLDSGFPEKQPA
jgi:Short repeat of unknown function (DUF308)